MHRAELRGFGLAEHLRDEHLQRRSCEGVQRDAGWVQLPWVVALSGKGGSIAVVAQASSASTPDPDLSNNVASLTTTVKKK